MSIGKVTSIQKNQAPVTEAKVGDEVAVRFEVSGGVQPSYGRHFDHQNLLASRLTRESIDVLKSRYADALSTADWKLVIKLKAHFGIH